MITIKKKTDTIKNRFSLSAIFLFAFLLLGSINEAFAQDYEVTLNQRRLGSQIGVEVWVKSLNSSAANLGNMTISVKYDNLYLTPSSVVSTSDSISTNMELTTPVITLTSPFAQAANGFQALTAQAVDDGANYYYKLETNVQLGGGTGYQPGTTGKGSFVGMLKFDIKTSNFSAINNSTVTGVSLSTTNFATNVLLDINGTDVTASSTMTQPSSFTVRGITLLNPNGPSQTVNRYPLSALTVLSPNLGYPIYFERSGLVATAAKFGEDRYLAYSFQYSLDNGTSWTEIGAAAEDATAGITSTFGEGDLDYPSAGVQYFLTKVDGSAMAASYGGIVRTIWKANANFPYRSEVAKLRVRELDTTGVAVAAQSRTAFSLDTTTRWDMSNANFVLGRLMFVQLDGVCDYFKSTRTFSNATQLTVEAWINLNSIQTAAGAEPGIVVSSASTASPEEGAWMLYLKDGKYPAFRAREFQGRGTNGYIGTVISPYALTAYSDASPLTTDHSRNWVHIAATVENNLIRLFVNGEEVGRALNEEDVNIRMLTTNHPIWIGVNPNLGISAEDYLHAGIKEVKIWRLALTQDQIRANMSGVYQPTNVAYGDERSALEMYYPMQAAISDYASVFYEQNGLTPLSYYSCASTSPDNTLINYRPDRSHITLTSPVGGEGVQNLLDKTFPVRWAAYGIGSTAPNTSDLQIMVSRDGGTTWFDAIDNQTPAMPMDTMEVEQGEALWEPYNNATLYGQSDDLQGIIDVAGNYAKSVLLKISGTAANDQEAFADTSAAFTVAPNFAFQNNGAAKLTVNGNTDLNLSQGVNVLEAWIRPYRFPTTNEGYFPIASKKSADGTNLTYALRLLPTGQLQYLVSSSTGATLRTATSSSHMDSVIKAPNVIEYDTAWTHVAVYANLTSTTGETTVMFYIDGTPQYQGALSTQLGSALTVSSSNADPVYIGFEPGTTVADDRYFIGAMKEVRFWNGNPGGQATASNVDISPLTYFIQGAQTIRANELGVFNGNDYASNLVAAYIMNGGSWTNEGIKNCIAAYPSNANLVANISGTGYGYEATKPTIKVIAPTYKQRAANSKTDLKVRWTGFDFNRNNLVTFRTGNDAVNHADLEFSFNGGGNTAMLPYQYVASEVHNPTYTDAMTIYTSQSAFEFPGTTLKSQYAAELNLAVTDPDLNDDETYTDQGAIAAAKSNARLRLRGRSTINGYTLEYNNGASGEFGEVSSLRSESQLFTITPPSNFTVRVLLEGYHQGSVTGIVSNLGTTGAAANGNGLTINLYNNNANTLGTTLVASSVSENGVGGGYLNTTTALTPGSADFANVPFVFDGINDGRYYVVVDHINHLPVMSRWAAPFQFSGDNATTAAIESGWDFSKWNGTNNSTMTLAESQTVPPTYGTTFSAYGYAYNTPANTEYGTTALIYNDGQAGAASNQIAAMIGGDVYKDGAINAKDRTRVVADDATDNPRSDVSGDGLVNATDRTIVYRNTGKEANPDIPTARIQSRDNDIAIPMIREYKDIDPNYPDLSLKFIEVDRAIKANAGKVENNNTKDEVNTLQGAIEYKVTANPTLDGEFINIPVYIQNVGANWAPANCTFGITYETANLQFVEMNRTNNVIFSDRDDMGYQSTFTAPSFDAKNPISDLRTIDINFENHRDFGKKGIAVPYAPTYLGTLKFKVVSPKDAYFFKWSPITVVYSVENGDVTADGKFLPIAPVIINKQITIIAPNGGENLSAGKPYTITWTKPSTDNLMGNIEFSADNGASWQPVASNVNLAGQTYNWSTPKVTSTECLIAIKNATTGTIIDKSDATFTITTTEALITKPSSMDPIYKGGASDMIKWEIGQNVKVRFEFSENGSSNWTSVTPTLNSNTLQANWILPSVNTKSAVVRMINVDNGEVLAVSSPFKVLAGSVTLLTPTKGEVLKFGAKKPVRWNYENVSTFDLQLSVNNGQTWSMMTSDAKAATKLWDWMVPNVTTKEAIVRAIYKGDGELEYSRTPLFEIKGNGSDVENPEAYGYKLATAVPNPFRIETTISFTIPTDDNVTIAVYSENGVEVARLAANEFFGAGTHSVNFKAGNLASGMYMIRMTVGAYTLTDEVVLVK